ncbi:hypothetical protein ACS0TY_034595 [Phlomoides rotata]
MASMFLYVVFNMLVGRNGNLDMYKCFSLIGYCMLPNVLLSAISLFVPQGVPMEVWFLFENQLRRFGVFVREPASAIWGLGFW